VSVIICTCKNHTYASPENVELHPAQLISEKYKVHEDSCPMSTSSTQSKDLSTKPENIDTTALVEQDLKDNPIMQMRPIPVEISGRDTSPASEKSYQCDCENELCQQFERDFLEVSGDYLKLQREFEKAEELSIASMKQMSEQARDLGFRIGQLEGENLQLLAENKALKGQIEILQLHNRENEQCLNYYRQMSAEEFKRVYEEKLGFEEIITEAGQITHLTTRGEI
jgi:hypothetical protein